jgi:hypothetical protein
MQMWHGAAAADPDQARGEELGVACWENQSWNCSYAWAKSTQEHQVFFF